MSVEPSCFTIAIPAELIDAIFSFLRPESAKALACTARVFNDARRRARVRKTRQLLRLGREWVARNPRNLIIAGSAAAWEYNQVGHAWFPNGLHLFVVGGGDAVVLHDPHSVATLSVGLDYVSHRFVGSPHERGPRRVDVVSWSRKPHWGTRADSFNTPFGTISIHAHKAHGDTPEALLNTCNVSVAMVAITNADGYVIGPKHTPWSQMVVYNAERRNMRTWWSSQTIERFEKRGATLASVQKTLGQLAYSGAKFVNNRTSFGTISY
jgi:hypothetical protein